MDPNVFGFSHSLNLVTGTIVGGLLSIWGGALGAVIIIGLRELLRDLSLPLWEAVIMGGLTVLVLIVFPRGIAGFVGDLFDRLAAPRRARFPVTVQPDFTAPSARAEPVAGAGPLLEVADVGRSFGNLRAVNRVSFAVQPGSITALIGPNGAGKTTLFNLVCGQLPLDFGVVRFAGRPIQDLPPRDIAMRGIGRTFQNLQLFDNMTVLENVMCGRHRLTRTGILAITARLPGVGREEREARAAARDCLRFVGLQGADDMRPSELAFGHQRLVEIARALALRPRLLLLDEPSLGLAPIIAADILVQIGILRDAGTTVLIVEQNARAALAVANRGYVMENGRITLEGRAAALLDSPAVRDAYLGGQGGAHGVEARIRDRRLAILGR
jgi:branched-chain amino acid transport system permease protein